MQFFRQESERIFPGDVEPDAIDISDFAFNKIEGQRALGIQVDDRIDDPQNQRAKAKSPRLQKRKSPRPKGPSAPQPKLNIKAQ